jgi:hypothetical protein
MPLTIEAVGAADARATPTAGLTPHRSRLLLLASVHPTTEGRAIPFIFKPGLGARVRWRHCDRPNRARSARRRAFGIAQKEQPHDGRSTRSLLAGSSTLAVATMTSSLDPVAESRASRSSMPDRRPPSQPLGNLVVTVCPGAPAPLEDRLQLGGRRVEHKRRHSNSVPAEGLHGLRIGSLWRVRDRDSTAA